MTYPVVQEDRDAAAERLERKVATWPCHPSLRTAQMIRIGKFDKHEWVQSAARYRLAVEAESARQRMAAHAAVTLLPDARKTMLEMLNASPPENTSKADREALARAEKVARDYAEYEMNMALKEPSQSCRRLAERDAALAIADQIAALPTPEAGDGGSGF